LVRGKLNAPHTWQILDMVNLIGDCSKDAGIDENLAKRARKLAKLPEGGWRR
jgi:hypothetical protein